jgi:hypothetical protein
MERWKAISDYPLYEVSTWGRVRSYHTGKAIIMKGGTLPKTGHRYVALSNNIDKRNFYVHRLVAQAFIPNPEVLPEINHKDNISYHNYYRNLEWVTHWGNMLHAMTRVKRKYKSREYIQAHELK